MAHNYDPDELVFDNPNTPAAKGLKGAGLNVAGRMQGRQRNPFARSMGPGWGGYFGVMQAKENAANAAGKRFDFDAGSWGNDPVKPGTIFEADQVPASVQGIYNTTGLNAREILAEKDRRRGGR